MKLQKDDLQVIQKMASFLEEEKGGAGSGNFDHSGRPGERGGSGEGGGGGGEAPAMSDNQRRDGNAARAYQREHKGKPFKAGGKEFTVGQSITRTGDPTMHRNPYQGTVVGHSGGSNVLVRNGGSITEEHADDLHQHQSAAQTSRGSASKPPFEDTSSWDEPLARPLRN